MFLEFQALTRECGHLAEDSNYHTENLKMFQALTRECGLGALKKGYITREQINQFQALTRVRGHLAGNKTL